MTCPACGGSGWVIRECNGVTSAERCDCSKPYNPPGPSSLRPPTPSEFMAAALYLSRVIDFGPSDPEIIQLTAAEMSEYVSTKGQLDVLIRAAKVQLNRWSLRGLREIFCRMFDPKDQAYLDENPNAGEMRAIEESGRKFFEKIAEFKRKAIAAPANYQPAPPAQTEPLPGLNLAKAEISALPRPRVIGGDLGRLIMDPDSGDFRRETLKECEERIAAEAQEAALYNRRTPEDRARMIADLEAQVLARMERKRKISEVAQAKADSEGTIQ